MPFPAWLPPDPKAPPPVVVQPVYNSTVGSRYGGMGQQGAGPGSSGLSSLWDNQAAPPPQQDPQSLRRGAGGRGGAAPGGGAVNQRPNPFTSRQGPAAPTEQVQARPLPSQRAGSYQTAAPGYGRTTSPQPAAATAAPGGRSAQEKLKDRFRNAAKSASSLNSVSSNSSAGDDGGSGNRFVNTVQAARQNSFGPSAGGTPSSDRPVMSATAPWAGGPDEFSGFGYGGGGGGGGGYDYDGSRGGGRQGLPSNPAARRGPGLPSGPRSMR